MIAGVYLRPLCMRLHVLITSPVTSGSKHLNLLHPKQMCENFLRPVLLLKNLSCITFILYLSIKEQSVPAFTAIALLSVDRPFRG